MESNMLTPKETANYLGISYQTLMRLKKKNPERLPPCINFSKTLYRWNKETLDKWIKANERRSEG